MRGQGPISRLNAALPRGLTAALARALDPLPHGPYPAYRYAHVPALRQDPPPGPRGGRDPLPPAPPPRRPRPPDRRRRLRLPPPRLAGPPARRARHPPGDGRRRRPGADDARHPPNRDMAGLRPRPDDARHPVPLLRPPRPRVRPRPDARRGHRRAVQAQRPLLSRLPAPRLPDTAEVPRRASPPRRPLPPAAVHNERPLLLRHRLRGAGRLVPEDVRRLQPRVRALRPADGARPGRPRP